MQTSRKKVEKLKYNEPKSMAPTRLKPELRNMSNRIFDTEPCHDVSGSQERWCTDAAAVEKLKREEQEIKRRQRHQIKQQYLHEIEEHRWYKMAHEQQKHDKIIEYKHNSNRYNNGSVAYNPITLDYLNNERGMKLKQKDLQVQRKSAVKALSTHIQCNTFNPITGEDIIVGASQPNRGGQSTTNNMGRPSAYEVQKPGVKLYQIADSTVPLPTVKFVVPNNVPETTTKILAHLVQKADNDIVSFNL